MICDLSLGSKVSYSLRVSAVKKWLKCCQKEAKLLKKMIKKKKKRKWHALLSIHREMVRVSLEQHAGLRSDPPVAVGHVLADLCAQLAHVASKHLQGKNVLFLYPIFVFSCFVFKLVSCF